MGRPQRVRGQGALAVAKQQTHGNSSWRLCRRGEPLLLKTMYHLIRTARFTYQLMLWVLSSPCFSIVLSSVNSVFDEHGSHG